MFKPTAIIFALLSSTTAFANSDEVARIQAHLDGAIEMVQSRDVSGLTAEQLERRAAALQHLIEYRDAGRFPVNRDFDERTPYFVDADGTRCAMAHLIETSGEAALVADVAARRNNAYVRELVDEPALVDWLQVNGISVDEAARIQPAYGCDAAASCVCGTFIAGPTTGAVAVRWTTTTTGTEPIVEDVRGDVVGFVAGETFSGADRLPPRQSGDETLVFISTYGTPAVSVINGQLEVDTDGNVNCRVDGTSVAIPQATAMSAAASADCVGKLGAIDGRLADRSHCSGDGLDDAGGCETARPSSSWMWSLLLAAAAIVFIRRRSVRG